MMSSLTYNSLRTRPSFGATSSHSTSSQSQLETQGSLSASGPRRRTGSDGVSNPQDEKREENSTTDVNDNTTMIVTTIEEDADVLELPQLVPLAYAGETTFRESGLSPVHESTADGYGAGEHAAIANNLSQEVELMSTPGILLDAEKEEEDEVYWRRFYVVLSVLVLAGVISAVVVSIINHTRETRRLLWDE
jgi:hypothetical protein